MAFIDTKSLSRRVSLQVVLAGLAAASLAHPAFANANQDLPPVSIWKTAKCDCCKEWVSYLRTQGFEVKRLLLEKPVAIGLAVPSMPVGSPGMEMKGEMLGVRDAFDVVLVTQNGGSRV